MTPAVSGRGESYSPIKPRKQRSCSMPSRSSSAPSRSYVVCGSGLFTRASTRRPSLASSSIFSVSHRHRIRILLPRDDPLSSNSHHYSSIFSMRQCYVRLTVGVVKVRWIASRAQVHHRQKHLAFGYGRCTIWAGSEIDTELFSLGKKEHENNFVAVWLLVYGTVKPRRVDRRATGWLPISSTCSRVLQAL